MIFNKFKKAISVFTIFAYLIGFIAIPANTMSDSYDGLSEMRFINNDLVFDTTIDQGTDNIYLDGSKYSESDLLSELNTYYSAQLVGAERATSIDIYSGDNCAATACAVVTVDYGSYSFEYRTNYHLTMSSGSQGSTSYISYSGTSTGDKEATSNQKKTLARINTDISKQNTINSGVSSDIERANSELSRQNSNHSTAKSSLASVELKRDRALSSLNTAITNRNNAVNERQQAKQEASNAKAEADRQATAVNVQENTQDQLEDELAQLENDTANLVSQIDNYTGQLQSNRSTIDQNIVAAKSEISQTLDRHNQIVDSVINDLGISQAVEDLDIDYSELVQTPNDLEAPVLPNGAEIQMSKSHPKYDDLVDAINYHESIREHVESSTSEQVKHAHDLSEIGILMADEAYAQGDDQSGDEFLENSLTVLDSVLDFVPGISFIKDVTSIATGINPITGEEVSDTERAIMLGAIFAPAIVSGTAKVTVKVGKALQVLSQRGGRAGEQADNLVDSLRRSDEDMSKFVTNPCRATVAVPSSGNWVQALAMTFATSLVPMAYADEPCALGEITAEILDQPWGKQFVWSQKAPHTTYDNKHYKAISNSDAIRKSSTGDKVGQYWPKDSLTTFKLEREALDNGYKVKKSNSTIHAYHCSDQIVGYAAGKPTYWMRAEYTSGDNGAGGTIHGHPRGTNDKIPNAAKKLYKDKKHCK
ncbi:pre-toxin TG domain-containing protein [Pseudomonas sp. HK3]